MKPHPSFYSAKAFQSGQNHREGPPFALRISDLNKIYSGSRKRPPKAALTDIDLKVRRGAVFGLLGPNGAGKSTLINILAQLVRKSRGTVAIWDFDLDRAPRHAASAIGVVPQELNMDPFFTPFTLLDLQAGLYGVPKRERQTEQILRQLGLWDKANAYARTLSGGMKRRLMVAKAMVHSPPILVLDEPTAGVDIELRQQLWDHVRHLNQEGVTILLTTHYLEEAEQLCDEIAIINHGRILVCEDKRTLLSRIDSKGLLVTAASELLTIPESLIPYQAQLVSSRQIQLNYQPSRAHMGEVLAALQKGGIDIVDLITIETDLEDIFLHLTR